MPKSGTSDSCGDDAGWNRVQAGRRAAPYAGVRIRTMENAAAGFRNRAKKMSETRRIMTSNMGYEVLTWAWLLKITQ